ncbi:hypothetical protein BTUL_0249g00090 [Botrytis tulipae]|uniref:Uncharacterized protein n=1 Tax=Botrytis tulipae TaxID=87230 RepID=A0A4Z1EAZ5_9HELO|nr:hypothetical protein BTUL_0249g00090 [Botrytis tulipae]
MYADTVVETCDGDGSADDLNHLVERSWLDMKQSETPDDLATGHGHVTLGLPIGKLQLDTVISVGKAPRTWTMCYQIQRPAP